MDTIQVIMDQHVSVNKYLKENLWYKFYLLVCDPNCETCTGGTSADCTICKDNYFK